MNQELATIIKKYSTESHEDLNRYLLEKSKDNLIASLVDLITMYINDKNSSTLREFLTVTLAGYTHLGEKIGYNGFKQKTSLKGTRENLEIKCEAKPKNILTSSGKNKKLNGYGNFSDYTFARLEKDSKEKNLKILVSGFIDGKIIYLLEFPFNYKNFVLNLRKQLLKRFPGGKDIPTEYLRSANFSYKDFSNCKELKIVYLIKPQELERYRKYFIKDFYDFLIKLK